MVMRKVVAVAIGCVVFFSVACNRSSAVYEEQKASDYSAALSADETEAINMERTMEMRFRTVELNAAIRKLESLSKRYGGYVSRTEESMDEADLVVQPKGDDSLMEIRKLIPRGNMTMYVKNEKLDSFVAQCAILADYMEYKNYTSENQQMKNAFDSGTYVSANSQKAKSLRVAYSKVMLNMYQPPVLKKWTIPNTAAIDKIKPGFGYDVWNAVKLGWKGIGIFLIGMVALWPLWLVLFLLYALLIRRWIKKYRLRQLAKA